MNFHGLKKKAVRKKVIIDVSVQKLPEIKKWHNTGDLDGLIRPF